MKIKIFILLIFVFISFFKYTTISNSCYFIRKSSYFYNEIHILKSKLNQEKQIVNHYLSILKAAKKHAIKLIRYNKNLQFEDAIKYGFWIEIYAQKRDLDPDLIISIIIVESHVNFKAESHIGAVGLMQIHHKVWKSEICSTKKEMFIPKVNIRYGTKILKYYITKYNNNLIDGVMAYNTGSAKKVNYKYVRKVFNIYFNLKNNT